MVPLDSNIETLVCFNTISSYEALTNNKKAQQCYDCYVKRGISLEDRVAIHRRDLLDK